MSRQKAMITKQRLKSKLGIRAAVTRLILGCCLVLVSLAGARAIQTEAAQQSVAGSPGKAVGTVKAISGNRLTLSTDTGATIVVTVTDSARVVRVVPGQKDLKDAPSVQLSDVQIGDRILARGTPSSDAASVAAVSVIVMKGADVVAKQDREREDWQKHGIGGLVTSVAATGTVVISTQTVGEAKPVAVHVSKDTIIRRYSPDSVKFDDARAGTIDEIKPGDQMRARGTRSPEGTELTAEEVVSGSFRNIAGTVVSTDAGGSSLTVMDLVAKKPVVLKVTPDSQLRKLPTTLAQRIATRLRGDLPPGSPGASSAAKPGDTAGDGGPGGAHSGGQPDFQQMLKRMPAVALVDLQKGDAVMVVTTQGTATTEPTTITLLSGVEPILSASPSGTRAAMLLSPWNLGGGGDGAGP